MFPEYPNAALGAALTFGLGTTFFPFGMKRTQGADRAEEDRRRGPRSEHLGTQIDVTHVHQAPRSELVSRKCRCVRAKRGISIHATLQIAPMGRWHLLPGGSFEIEHVQGFRGRGKRRLVCRGVSGL